MAEDLSVEIFVTGGNIPGLLSGAWTDSYLTKKQACIPDKWACQCIPDRRACIPDKQACVLTQACVYPGRSSWWLNSWIISLVTYKCCWIPTKPYANCILTLHRHGWTGMACTNRHELTWEAVQIAWVCWEVFKHTKFCFPQFKHLKYEEHNNP